MVDVETQTGEGAAVDSSGLNSSNSSEGSIETVEPKQENNVNSVVQFDGIDIVEDCGNREDRPAGLIKSGDVAQDEDVVCGQSSGANQLRASEEDPGINDVCEGVSDKVLQLNFFIGQSEKGVICPAEDAKRQVIELIKSISGDLEKVYSNQNELFSDLLVSFCDSQSIWGEREDLDQFKKIIVRLARLEGCKDSDVDSALGYMISKRDYGYDY